MCWGTEFPQRSDLWCSIVYAYLSIVYTCYRSNLWDRLIFFWSAEKVVKDWSEKLWTSTWSCLMDSIIKILKRIMLCCVMPIGCLEPLKGGPQRQVRCPPQIHLMLLLNTSLSFDSAHDGATPRFATLLVVTLCKWLPPIWIYMCGSHSHLAPAP